MGRERTQEKTAQVIERLLCIQGMPLDTIDDEDVMSPQAGVASGFEEYQIDHDFITGDFMRDLLLEAGIDPEEFQTAAARDPEGLRAWVQQNLGPLN